MSGTTRRILVALLGLLLAPLAGTVSSAAQKMVEPPPNAPATVEWNAEKGRLSVRYQGTVLLIAAVGAENPQARAVPDAEIRLDPVETTGEKVEQRLRFVLAKPQESMTLVLRGTVTGSEEAFPAETQGEAQKRFPLVRTSVGLSHSRRNNAVFDRRWDWVLSGPGDGATLILPRAAAKDRTCFAWESRGTAIELVFRPRFYQKHRGLAYFEPWTYRVWKGSVTGYCTWWAYKHAFSQETLDAIVDVFCEKKLPDFGYKYIQLDDAYQIGNGSCPQNWLTWNPKFPGGAEYALRKIRSAGMEGGIWVHRIHRPSDPNVADLGKKHPDWFVKKPDGSLFTAHGFYVLDTKNQEALDEMVRPIYRGHKEQGWRYVKIDGAGDLLSAYKNRECMDHFKRVNSTPEQSLRDWDRVAREVLGPDVYILNCWGVSPGLSVVGLADGCRLSSDGFQPETLANHISYEGVVWRNDPDHCDILGSWLMDENAKMRVFGRQDPVKVVTVVRPAICSIAGGVLMTSDKVEVYKDDQNLEGMKRSAPVLPAVPGQLYDPGHGSATWWLQEVERPFERWSVLSRIQWAKKREKEWKFDLKGLPPQEVRFADLGLPSDREYLVFEFWTQTFLGKFKDSFTAPAMDEHSGMQVFAIRQARPHPWLLSTTRHLSQGGVDLLDERWDAKAQTLSGKSAVVAGDPYVLTVHLPQGHQLKNVQFSGERVQMANQAETATVRIVPSATKTVEWKMDFALGLGPAPAAASKPNIILCMTDDQGWGDVSYNGHPELKTPELDKMAAAGIRFDRFYSAHPMCSPTRASCLTGRGPTRYVCMTWGHDLPLREVTIAEAVRTAGYVTGHFGKWHLGGIEHAAGGTGRGLPESFDAQPRHPGNQGFDEWWSAGNNYDIGYEPESVTAF